VKCYIDNFVRLRSYIRNINKHFWRRCRGESQYLLSVYRLHRIILASILSLTDLSASLCLCLVFAWRCMTGFDLPANYHSDPESLIRKSRSRFSSPGSSGSHVWGIVDKFQVSPPPQEPAQIAGQKCSNAFLAKFFLLGKTNALCNKISTFQQVKDVISAVTSSPVAPET
jgi:hypothetical protein